MIEVLEHPKIIVGVPVYNEGRHLEEALCSLQNQRYRDFKVLISDNASSDESLSIAKRFSISDERFHLFRHSRNIGALANFEFLRQRTNSPYFMWFGGHDRLSPDYLSKCLRPYQYDESISLSYSLFGMIRQDGRVREIFTDDRPGRLKGGPVARYFQASRLVHGYEINHVIRRSAMADYQFETSIGWDKVFLSHLAYQGRFHCVREPLYCFRDAHVQNSDTAAMERLTGRPGLARDNQQYLDHFLRDFSRLTKGATHFRLSKWLLTTLLQHRILDSPPSAAGKFLRWASRVRHESSSLRDWHR